MSVYIKPVHDAACTPPPPPLHPHGMLVVLLGSGLDDLAMPSQAFVYTPSLFDKELFASQAGLQIFPGKLD